MASGSASYAPSGRSAIIAWYVALADSRRRVHHLAVKFRDGFRAPDGYRKLHVGEAERAQPDIISDAVNLTARIEGLTKRYGASVIVSGETLEALHFPDQ